ncbi:MAG: homoserine dehydrogenase [Lachnospiraceae bacterium]|nr:homoserine dehydrogenase [Lachnospiraceae bacterium]
MIKAAVFGYGNIGSGVVRVIEENADRVEKAVGDKVEVKYVLDLREFEGDPIRSRVVHDVDVIVNDPEIQIISETMGGNEPAYTFTKKALEAGKSVCTSNKELVANHGAELIRIAAEHHCNYFFEASVGGGIPIIRTINEALTQEHLLEISGIVNGTTNYILTKMDREGAAFDTVLKQAQDLGYAERNPEADIEGYDAVRKIAILSSLMSGQNVNYEDLHVEGITKISSEDFLYAAKLNRSIKLLATAKKVGEKYLAMVAPFMLSKDHPLASANDVFNAVFVKGDMLDDSMYYGRGAGKLPTASAVVADVIEAARNLGRHLPINWEEQPAKLVAFEDAKHCFFVRIDRASADEAKAKEVFGKGEVVTVDALANEFAYLTEEMSEKEFAAKKASLNGVLSAIRVDKRA